MPQEQPAADQLMVALSAPAAFVHVTGRGSFKVSTSLKQFGLAAVAAHCRSVVFDMADCHGMDSTFMGVLAGLAARLAEQCAGTIFMVNLSPRTRSLLATLGLDQVVRTYMAGATPPEFEAALAACEAGERQRLDGKGVSKRATAETMLEAHENLVQLSPDNLPKFKDVLTFLREDLERGGDEA